MLETVDIDNLSMRKETVDIDNLRTSRSREVATRKSFCLLEQ